MGELQEGEWRWTREVLFPVSIYKLVHQMRFQFNAAPLDLIERSVNNPV